MDYATMLSKMEFKKNAVNTEQGKNISFNSSPSSHATEAMKAIPGADAFPDAASLFDQLSNILSPGTPLCPK